MRKCALVIISCVFPLVFWGQNLDSLWSVWKDPSKPDTSRARALGEYNFGKFMYQNVDSASYYARVLMRFCDERQIRDAGADAVNSLAQNMLTLGITDSAIHYFTEAIGLYAAVGNKKGIAGANINIGIVYANIGVADSAISRYRKGIAICDEIDEVDYKLNALNNLGVVYLNRGEIDHAIPVFEEVIKVASADKYGSDAHKGGLVNLGFAHTKQGNYAAAIGYFNRCLELIDKYGGEQVAGFAHSFLGTSYKNLGETDNALIHFRKAYEIAEQVGDKSDMGMTVSHIAEIYAERGEREKARQNFRRAMNLMLEVNRPAAALQPLGKLAELDIEEGNLDSAEYKYRLGIEQAIELEQFDQEGFMLGGLGKVFLKRGEYRRAIETLNKSYTIGRELNYLDIRLISANSLFSAHKALGNPGEALRYFEEYVTLKDSTLRDENKRAAIQQEFRYAYRQQAMADSLEFVKKEALNVLEIEKRDANLARQRIGLGAAGGGLLLLGLLAYSIRQGKRRSDELLHMILPEEVAAELKQKGYSEAHLFEETTVLFTDFKGFTGMAESMSPQDLVHFLNRCFSEFDRITSKYGIEKIKTIGDSYMAAGGLPSPDPSHARHVVMAGLEMVEFIEKGRRQVGGEKLPDFEIRIGIHTGPVVAGIVGVKKFQYDIWGDTVNTASRMESSGEAGRVNISRSTYELVKGEPGFTFESRGHIEAKGKGEIAMFFVSGSGGEGQG